MFALKRTARILCGVSPMMLLFGCYSAPYQSGYNSPYGPAPYGTPGGTYMAPGGAYQRGVPSNNGDANLGQPGNIGGANGAGSGAPTPANGNNGGNNGGTGGSANGGGNLVPNYGDPNSSTSGLPKKTTDAAGFASDPSKGTGAPANSGGMGDGGTGNNGMGDNGTNSGGMKSNDPPKSPFSSGAAFQPSSEPRKIKLTGGDNQQQPFTGGTSGVGAPEPRKFQPPKDAGLLPDASKSPVINDTKTPKKLSPYDYDQKLYTWLRGRLDYDETTKTWQLMYSLNAGDKYGGVLTLNDDPRLKKLRSGDVVLVEGKIDETKKDSLNKPRYLVQDLFGPLVPKSQLGQSAAKGGNSQARNDSTGGMSQGSGAPFPAFGSNP